jgi:adenylate cyclase
LIINTETISDFLISPDLKRFSNGDAIMSDEGFKRKLAAILSADVEGYSLLMGQDEEATIRTLTAYRSEVTDLVLQYRGRVVDAPGDNILAEFASVVDAVNCAVEIQRALGIRNAKLPEDRKMQFRIGVNIGDVIEDENRIYGDGVNIAARVEALAEAGGICISGRVYDQVENKLKLEYAYLGEHQVKNIRRPIQVYRVINQSNSIERFIFEEGEAFSLPDKPSIAVLPFTNMSGDSEQEYFSDGLTEDIITALSRSPWLFVIARNSSFAYRGAMVDVKQVSRELGVRYILEGSVRKAGNRVRVNAQLIDGSVGSHVWAEKYDGELQDIFDLQDQITQQVVASLLTQIQLNFGESVRQLERPDVVTWELLARGWKLFYELTEEGLAKAEKLFRRAVASTPKSCDAHHLLAATIIHRAQMGYIEDEKAAISESYELAKRAIVIDERNEYAHWTLGFIQLWRLKHELAVAELKRAIELNPNCSLAFGSLGTVLSYSGEADESIKNNEIAIRLNPRDISIFFRYSGLAMAHFMAGRYSEAVQWASKCINRKPNWRVGHAILATSLSHLNLLEEAKEAVNIYIENIPNETISKLSFLPFKNPNDARRFEEGLRKAGLPE